MLNPANRRVLLERLIVAELLAKRGEGPLARRHFVRSAPPKESAARAQREEAREPEERG